MRESVIIGGKVGNESDFHKLCKKWVISLCKCKNVDIEKVVLEG